MSKNSSRTAGRHFLQIPGPTPVPDRILRAMDMPVIDHRGPEFGKLGRRVLDGIKTIFRCAGSVIIYPASGTGAGGWWRRTWSCVRTILSRPATERSISARWHATWEQSGQSTPSLHRRPIQVNRERISPRPGAGDAAERRCRTHASCRCCQ